jgi:beta-lactamase regulating signal transducer with metallopeptidase domain
MNRLAKEHPGFVGEVPYHLFDTEFYDILFDNEFDHLKSGASIWEILFLGLSDIFWFSPVM